MEIERREITIRELAKDYSDDGDGGVRGDGGKLDVRPAYQREFVYPDRQRDAVIETVQQDFPLNVMYWADRGDGTFEIIDGQQRTISICRYVTNKFSIDGLAFHNLQKDQKEKILDYPLMVYVCTGTDSERLRWFETINISGMVLTAQELRNAVYHGSWLSDAKRRFSRQGCPAYEVGSKLLNGSPIRQDYLETAIRWINDGDIRGYMSKHQHDKSAVSIWNHFRSVIDWTNATFPNYRKQMKGVDWGTLYKAFGDDDLDPDELEKEASALFQNDDVTNKSGIYSYLLDWDERHLNIRAFSDTMKAEAFERQGGVCPLCKETFKIDDMQGDHITPWSEGGKTNADNLQMLCKDCNRRKGAA